MDKLAEEMKEFRRHYEERTKVLKELVEVVDISNDRFRTFTLALYEISDKFVKKGGEKNDNK